MDIVIHNHYAFDDTKLLGLINQILKNQKKIMTDLTALTTEVEENGEVIASAVTLLQGLKIALDEAGTDPVKLKELSDSLDKNTNALAEAVAANTPAE